MIHFLWKVGDWFPKWNGGGRFICTTTVFPFGWPSHLNLPSQGSFDHPKGYYVRDSWEDVFSSCDGSAGKLLVGHLLRDGSRLEKMCPGNKSQKPLL